jgi:t-SNARE complex subunit (syntaxin)
MEMLIEGLYNYLESDIRSFDKATSKMHLFSVTFQGDAHDHSGEGINDKMLELIRRYAMIKKNWKRE